MTISRARGAKAKADVLFSKIIRSRGCCEKCGETNYAQLQTAHVISRRYAHVRVDADNAFCLCAKDHAYFTDHPVEFGRFVEQTLGRDAYDRLVEKARLRTKVDWPAEVERLKAALALVES